MALVQCPECGKEVSDRARQCPKCACPLGGKGVQTIEKTGKDWKLIQLVGALAAIGGTAAAGLKLSRPDDSSAAVEVLILLTGLIVFVVGRLGAWWFHG